MYSNKIITFLLTLLLLAWLPAYAQQPQSDYENDRKLSKKELRKKKKAEKKARKKARKQEKQKKWMLDDPQDIFAKTIKKDTAEVEDNPFLVGKKKRIDPPIDSVRLRGEQNPDTFILDRRYRAYGDTLTSKWYQNLFVQIGAGGEQMISTAKNYSFDPLTTFHLGAGIQIGKYNTLRLTGNVAKGYQKDYNRVFMRYGGRLEHFFDLSTYFNGYSSDRLLGVQTMIGVGGQMATLDMKEKRKGTAYEAHAGLQFHFYTGPRGSLNVEPYLGIATDDYDLSEQQNWRKLDTFYGVNLNYVYYFSNHLTRQARMNRLRSRNKRNRVIGDTLRTWKLHSWQAPWFIEFSAGPFKANAPELSAGESIGHEEVLTLGKWFSPVIGFRVSGVARSAMWKKVYTYTTTATYEQALYTHSYAGSIEAMFNPFGFNKNYNWNQWIGAYIVGGLEYGKFLKYQKGETLSCNSEAYLAGLHLWLRLTEGLHFFIEPQFIHNVYHIPYRNVEWNQRYSDNSYGLKIGLTAIGEGPSFRNKRKEADDDGRLLRYSAGLSGGYNLIHVTDQYMGDKHTNFNFGAFFQYHFNRVSAVRAGLEYMVHSRSDYTTFYDQVASTTSSDVYTTKRQGQWNHSYPMALLSLDYSMNMTNLMRGYRPGRFFELELFMGPAMVWSFKENGELSSKEMLREGHTAVLPKTSRRTFNPAAHGGVMLLANINKQWGITLTPQLYLVPEFNIHAIHTTRISVLETLDLGVQYKF